MKGYKGFDKDLKCRGKQYEIDKEFKEEEANICKCGIHFCENPLDVLNYYPLIDENCELNRFAEVESLDEVFTVDNKKFCTKKLQIVEELDLKGLIKVCFNFLFEKAKNNKDDKSILSVIESYSKISTSGNLIQFVSIGNDCKISSTGHHCKIVSTGDDCVISSCGCYNEILSSGDSSIISLDGHTNEILSTGCNCRIVLIGTSNKIVISGNYNKISTIGSSNKITIIGDHNEIIINGGENKVVIKGKNNICANIGIDGIVKGVKGSWITLAEYKYDYNLNYHICVCVKSAQIDGEILKEDVWYTLKNGEFVEVEEDER